LIGNHVIVKSLCAMGFILRTFCSRTSAIDVFSGIFPRLLAVVVSSFNTEPPGIISRNNSRARLFRPQIQEECEQCCGLQPGPLQQTSVDLRSIKSRDQPSPAFHHYTILFNGRSYDMHLRCSQCPLLVLLESGQSKMSKARSNTIALRS
jgi:hypothetical protein